MGKHLEKLEEKKWLVPLGDDCKGKIDVENAVGTLVVLPAGQLLVRTALETRRGGAMSHPVAGDEHGSALSDPHSATLFRLRTAAVHCAWLEFGTS